MSSINMGYIAMVWPSSSIHVKVDAQQRALRRMQSAGRMGTLLTTQCVTDRRGDDWVRFSKIRAVRIHRTGRLHSFANLLFGYPRAYRLMYRELSEARVDFVYIRKPPIFDAISIRFMRRLKKRGIRVVMEIPTYPYDREWKTSSVQARLDRQARRMLPGSVDLIATLSSDTSIFGVPCVNIDNCADVDQMSSIQVRAEDTGIRATVVAALEPWHRIDRILSALLDAWGRGDTRISRLNIVGEGRVSEDLVRMVAARPDVGHRVVFHGAVYGRQLGSIFHETDLAVGNLEEVSERGLVSVKPLKHREYAARGTPFVYGLHDPSFEGCSYALRLPDGPINIDKVVDWYGRVSFTQDQIRADAERFRWESQFESVIAALEGL